MRQEVLAHSPRFGVIPVPFVVADKLMPLDQFFLHEGQTYTGVRREKRAHALGAKRVPVAMQVEGDKLVITSKDGKREERSLDAGVADLRVRRDNFTFKLSVLHLPDRVAYNPGDFAHSDEAAGLLNGSWDPQDYDLYDR